MTRQVGFNTETVRNLIDQQMAERLKVVPWTGEEFQFETTCEVILPLHWSDGDAASVFVGERDGCLIVHDGGKIRNALYGAKEDGCSQAEVRQVEQQVRDLEINFDQDSGIAFVEPRRENLLYWLMEMSRIMTLVPHLFTEYACAPE